MNERRNKIVPFLLAYRTGKNQHLRADDGNGKSAHAFFSQHGAGGLIRGRRRRYDTFDPHLTFRAKGKPALKKFFFRHTQAVVTQNEKAIGTVVIDFRVVGIGIMSVFKKFADGRG